MMGELIVLWKSRDALTEDWKETSKKLDDDWKSLWRENDLLKAALENNNEALAKVASDPNEVTLAKVQASCLKAENGSLFLHTGQRIVDWLNEWHQRYDAQKRLERRSERFLGGAR
jgi:hypothetical protein